MSVLGTAVFLDLKLKLSHTFSNFSICLTVVLWLYAGSIHDYSVIVCPHNYEVGLNYNAVQVFRVQFPSFLIMNHPAEFTPELYWLFQRSHHSFLSYVFRALLHENLSKVKLYVWQDSDRLYHPEIKRKNFKENSKKRGKVINGRIETKLYKTATEEQQESLY